MITQNDLETRYRKGDPTVRQRACRRCGGEGELMKNGKPPSMFDRDMHVEIFSCGCDDGGELYEDPLKPHPSNVRREIAETIAYERADEIAMLGAYPVRSVRFQDGEAVLLLIVHEDALQETDRDKRQAELVCWVPGMWISHDKGGVSYIAPEGRFSWVGLYGTVTHAAPIGNGYGESKS